MTRISEHDLIDNEGFIEWLRQEPIFQALKILKQLQSELWQDILTDEHDCGNVEAWRVVTSAYEYVARQL